MNYWCIWAECQIWIKEQVNESLCLSVALHLVSLCFDSLLPFCLSPLLQWGWEGYFPEQNPKELLLESGEQGRTNPPAARPGHPHGAQAVSLPHILCPASGYRGAGKLAAARMTRTLYLGVRTLGTCPTPTLACCVVLNQWFALQASVLPKGKWILCSNSQISVKINKPEAKKADSTHGCPGQSRSLPSQSGGTI